MEVMRNAVVKTRTLKPLPGEITSQRISDATLPVKIEAARRAIAECTDLPELLRYKSQAEGLAAAVRTMKEVGPELIKRANEMMADAWRKGGELLSAYSNVPVIGDKQLNSNCIKGSKPSPRNQVSMQLGISPRESIAMVRIANATSSSAYVAANKSPRLIKASKLVPVTRPYRGSGVANKKAHSENALPIFRRLGEGHALLSKCPLDQFQHLTPDERKVVKAKIVEIQELLDEMDRLCR